MRRLGRIIGWGLAAVIILGVASYAWRTVSASAPLIKPSKTALIESPGRAINLPWPTYGQAAIGGVGYGVLASHLSSKPLPTASTAKIMTALCVLSKHPLEPGQTGPTITLTQKDVDLFNDYYAKNGSLVKVAAGEKINEYQALEAMLLPSANNMADTLAIWAFGSLAAYDNYANQYAKQLEMNHSHFAVDASGFDPLTVSTAADLVLLGQAAMESPVLAQIVAEKTANVPVAGRIENYNHLLGQKGIIGIKTGDNDQDKGAYMFAARHQVSPTESVIILGAVMSAPSVVRAEQDSLKLLATASHGFEQRQLVRAGDVVGSYPVPWRGNVDAIAQQNLSVLTWAAGSTKASAQLSDITPPTSANQVVGTISVQSTDRTITNDPVILEQAIPVPHLKWRLLHP